MVFTNRLNVSYIFQQLWSISGDLAANRPLRRRNETLKQQLSCSFPAEFCLAQHSHWVNNSHLLLSSWNSVQRRRINKWTTVSREKIFEKSLIEKWAKKMIEEKPDKRYNPEQTSLRHLTKYQLATHYLEVGSHFSIFRVPLTLKQFWNSESTWVGGEGKVDKMSSTKVQSVPRPLTRIEDNI